MTTTAPMTEQDYLKLVKDDPDGMWELHDGIAYSKSEQPMTFQHADYYGELGYQLRRQLDRSAFIVHWNAGRLRRSSSRYYIPDVIVIPRVAAEHYIADGSQLEIHSGPLPLVVEVWSPSTGGIDQREKLPQYKQRGDLEVWLLHRRRRTLTAWVRGDDGQYTETVYTGGIVRPAHLPNVVIDLDALFGDGLG